MWRIDREVVLVWQRSFSPVGQGEIDLEAIVAVADGFVAVGRDISIGRSNDVVVAKLAPDGRLVWRRSWGNRDRDDFGEAVIASGTDVIVAGARAAESRGWLLRVAAGGDRVW